MDLPLDAQANARKDRLAKLRSLKRKQDRDAEELGPTDANDSTMEASAVVLSGRNYDIDTKAPKLGFDATPSGDQETLESRAANIALETRNTITEDDNAEKSIDLLSLQPKKPNWDLKRDVEQKLMRLDALTNNAIARVVRERILQSQASSGTTASTTESGPTESLVEAVRQREREKDDIMDAEYT